MKSADGSDSTHFYIAVKPASDLKAVEPNSDDKNAIGSSNWAIAAAIIIAGMPHLWQWINGHQKARNSLTETLLQKLTDSYQLYSASSEQFRNMITGIAKRPTEVAESNALVLRDLQAEIADLRGQVLVLSQKIDGLGGLIARHAQTKP